MASEVVAPQVRILNVSIGSGAALSGAIDLGPYKLGYVHMPSAWTAANLTFQISYDGVAYGDLYDHLGGEYTVTAAASRAILVPVIDMMAVRYLKIRSGTAATPVNQAASRELFLTLVP